MSTILDNKKTQGTISGFEIISTESNNYNEPEKPYPYTKQAIYKLIRDLKRILNPNYLAYLDDLISKHIHNKDNPHQTTLEKMGTSVIKELYKEWQKYDVENTGSLDYFTKILFQDVVIASIATTLKGESLEQVPSVKAVWELLQRHNHDLNAHANLLNEIFIGDNIKEDPSFALNATTGLPSNFTVTRYTPMTFINSRGVLETAPMNTVVIDYQYGEPFFSIWGDRTNLFTHSNNFENDVWIKESCTTDISTEKKDPTNLEFNQMFFETVSNDTIHHCIKTDVELENNVAYTVSCFVRAAGRYCFAFSLENQPDINARFNLYTEETFLDTHASKKNITTEILPLGHGWFRCSMTFSSDIAGSDNIKFHLLDIHDGDLAYKGTTIDENGDIMPFWDESKGQYIILTNDDTPENSNLLGLDIFGAQFEKHNSMSPYIPTTDSLVTHEKTTIEVHNAHDWFSPLHGTICFDIYKPTNIKFNNTETVFCIHNDSTVNMTMLSTYSPTSPGRLNNKLYNSNNSAVASVWNIEDLVNKRRRIAFAYDSINIISGETSTKPFSTSVNSMLYNNSNTLTIGSSKTNTDYLNGYLKSFTYYPFKCNAEHLSFLIEVNYVE